MKKERRHDLQTNLLADYLGKKLEQIKPYANLIIGGVLAVVVIGGVWMAIDYFSGRSEVEAWVAYDKSTSETEIQQIAQRRTQEIDEQIENIQRRLQSAANGAERERLTKQWFNLLQKKDDEQKRARGSIRDRLREVMDSYPDSPAGWNARLNLADRLLEDAMNDLFRNPGAAEVNLKKAIEYYTKAKERIEDPMWRQRAQYGLARAYEARNENDPQEREKDDIERAKKEYRDLVQNSEAFGPAAKRRLAVLEGKAPFHEWLGRALDKKTSASKSTGTPPGLTP